MPSIVVVNNNDVILTTNDINYTGSVFPFIASLLLDEDFNNVFITGTGLYLCIANFAEQIRDYPGLKIRFSTKARQIPKEIDGRIHYRGSFFPDYISLDSKANQKRLPRKRINILNLDLIYEKPPPYAGEQLRAAEAIIQLQEARGLKRIRQTKGSIGTALLKASPQWENKRHAAPLFINRGTRSHLPGNYYAVSTRVKNKTLQDCYYIDQENAHHNIAVAGTIPHPHYIRGRGFYKQALQKKEYYPVWTTPDSPIGKCIINNHYSGLVLANVSCSTLPPTKEHLYPPWAKSRGRKYVWLWTPELRLFLRDHRFQLDSFVAGFLSIIRDSAIAEYGKWSLDYLQSNSRDKQYTKAILLSTYGMLAFNKDKYKRITRFWSGEVSGNRTLLPPALSVSERNIKLKDDIQHPTTNVIARGIIESETRTRTLEYAKELDEEGYHIAQIYVDGLLVQSKQLPFLKPGWRVTHELSNVYIPHVSWLISDQLTKTPGVPHTEDELRTMEQLSKARVPFIHKMGRLDRDVLV